MYRFIVATAVVGAQASSCPAQSKAVGVLLQDKANEMGVPCEEMCKRLGVYPDGCQCPGFNGQAPTPGDGRSCVAQWCQDPASPCPNDGFVECVDASSAVSALQWAKVMERVDTGFAALLETARMHKTADFKKSAESSAATCNKHDKAMQVLLQSKVESMGVPCEEMCKRLGVYPDGCQCPGFNGQAPTPGDGRSCVAQWCQDPASPCPNDGFVECVDASSAVSALQWAKVMERVDTGFAALLETARMHKTAEFKKSAESSAATCNKHDKAMQVLLQSKSESMGVPCEEMCKRLGVYPDGCQCPGFNGQAPTPGDGRSCVAQWCQDPASPCPNDGFVECVDASSAVSALQWNKVFAQVDKGLDSLSHMLTMMKNSTKK